jgi:hypothetical protein
MATLRSVLAIQTMTPEQVAGAVSAFAGRYVEDWSQWLNVTPSRRAYLFGQILRRWQATRPLPMRRTRIEGGHEPPYLEDLLESADLRVRSLDGLTVSMVRDRTSIQDATLGGLWRTFVDLPSSGVASCVGITKAIMLVSNGRIGPAFDSQVRERLGLPRPTSGREWIACLEAIADDIAAFETAHGPLASAVPAQFAHLADGRLYDMALGPRGETGA